MAAVELTGLVVGQPIVFAGNRVSLVTAALAEAFKAGDRLIVDTHSGDLLHIPAEQCELVDRLVTAAAESFTALTKCSDDQITNFFMTFAGNLEDDAKFAPIARANQSDLQRARDQGRSTGRLALSGEMRLDMIAGLRGWATMPGVRGTVQRTVVHDGWSVDAVMSPLGVVGFVFEGRPNVVADAAGVVRTGNTAVFRIGSDALGTATAILEHALTPALVDAGLPIGTICLLPSPARSAGWALFSDRRLSLAIARGSGSAVSQLGTVARQHGVAVSLHGTGGAWMIAAADADADWFRASVTNSLDRKVCNTLNVCCIVRSRAPDLVPVFVDAAVEAGKQRAAGARLHLTEQAAAFLTREHLERRVSVAREASTADEPLVTVVEDGSMGWLAHEWEWETCPEVSLHVVDDIPEALDLWNRHSPRFVVSFIGQSEASYDDFFASVDAPFVGNGFTRWVDGQFALGKPELGLSNWEHGRMLARGGILSGDAVHTIRYRVDVQDQALHR